MPLHTVSSLTVQCTRLLGFCSRSKKNRSPAWSIVRRWYPILQASAETARLWTRGHYVARCACLPPSLRLSQVMQLGDRGTCVSGLCSSARNTRSSPVPLLCVPFRRTSFARRSFSAAAPLTWNLLPPAVLNCDSLSTFKSRLKTHLYSTTFC